MPDAKVFRVALNGAGRDRLTRVVSVGAHPARMIMRARVLLALDGNDGSPAGTGVGRPTDRGERDDGAFGRGTVRRVRG